VREGSLMEQYIMLVTIEAYPDKADLVCSELSKIVELTRNEEGCLQYDLHVDSICPSTFVFYEIWQSKEHWKMHDTSEHIKKLRIATKNAISNTKVKILKLV